MVSSICWFWGHVAQGAVGLHTPYRSGSKQGADVHDEYIYPVGKDTGADTAQERTEESLGNQGTVAQRVQRGGIGAQVAAPAHAHGGAHGYGIAVYDALGGKLGNKAQGSTHGTQCGDGECHQFGGRETKEPLKHETYLASQPRQQLCALEGTTGVNDNLVAHVVHTLGGSAKGEHHHQGTDNEHAGNNSHTHINTRAATIEQ